MLTLALYHDNNGEPQQCVLEHPDSFNPAEVDLSETLPEFNSGGGLFLLSLKEGTDAITFTVTDEYGQDVTVHSRTFV